MKPILRYVIIAVSVIIIIAAVWFFMHIVAYILISAVLSLIGRPLVDNLGKIRIKKMKLPKTLRALITLIVIWIAFFYFFRIFVPLIANEVNNLSGINTENIVTSLKEPITSIESIVNKYHVLGPDQFTVEDFISKKVLSLFNLSFLYSFFGSFASLIGNIFIALFSISFITFFFLRDEKLFMESILSIVPDKHTEAFKHAMESIRHLLMRYFIGIIGQLTGIFILVSLGMTIVGIGFKHALIIALIAGSMNIVPYLGPLIGSSMGIILGIATHLDLDFNQELLPLILKMIGVYIIVHLIDNFIFQPFT